MKLARKNDSGKQTYDDHIEGVARRAQRFLEPLGLSDWGEAFARVHDLAKLREEWQSAVKQGNRPPSHSPEAAAVAMEEIDSDELTRTLLANMIYGHHSGLWDTAEVSEEAPSAKGVPRRNIPDLGKLSEDLKSWPFLARMVYSACVDADRLDAEEFNQGPRRPYPSLETLWSRFKADQEELMEESPPEGSVNWYRNRIYRQCLDASSGETGYYTATIPTGGGKTRSLAAFGLRHALEHGLRRVVIAVPYTSILEQNAREYRDIFGPKAVLEHHSLKNLEDRRHEKATGNWDAPFIITTTVQLFESLYSSRSGRARKIHRLKNSVVVLDEMQSLPMHVLEPCLQRLRDLVSVGSTVVCSTATNPGFDVGEATEIIDDPNSLAEGMERVKYSVTDSMTKQQLAQRLEKHDQVLTVCNTTKDARDIARMCEGAILLTSRQCPCDRLDIIEEVEERLEEGKPVRLVSTQVVEAGVDLDFPVAYRITGPVPSIIQVAGRCNREGILDWGRVYIVPLEDENDLPPGSYQSATSVTSSRLRQWDFKNPYVTDLFFDLLEGPVDRDENGVLDEEKKLKFESAGESFRMIPETATVVVPKDDTARRLIREIRDQEISREGWTSLQQYTISLHPSQKFTDAKNNGRITELGDTDLHVWQDPYDPSVGVFL